MSRRAVAALVSLLLLASPSFAEDDPKKQEDPKREVVTGGEWFKKGNWVDELDKAKAEAKKSGRAIFVYYCTAGESPFCRNLEKNVFSNDKFLDFAKKFVCYAQVTAKRKPTDQDLQELRAAKGLVQWPWFSFLDASGNLLLSLAPMMNLGGIEEGGDRILRYIEIAKRVKGGAQSDQRDLVIAALDLGRITIENAHERLQKLGELTEEQKKALALAETNNFVEGLSNKTDPANADAILAAGRKFVEHKKSGKPAPSYRSDIQPYWLAVMKVATTDKDPDLYEEALVALKDRYGNEPTAKAFFEGCAKTLEELKAAKK